MDKSVGESLAVLPGSFHYCELGWSSLSLRPCVFFWGGGGGERGGGAKTNMYG